MLIKEIFFFILVILTKCISEECIDSFPSFKNCTSVKNTSDNYSCCYFTAKINNKNSASCIRILKDLTIINDKISSVKKIESYKYEDVSIKCFSLYQFFDFKLIYILLILLI